MEKYFADSDAQGRSLRILCLGDVVGRPGRQVLRDKLPLLRSRLGLHMVIANGENAAGGIGLTGETLDELLKSGVDVVTSGNHVWKHREFYPFLDKNSRIVRPENQAAGLPGRGMAVYTLKDGVRVAVLNLLGRSFMAPAQCPFEAADCLLGQIPDDVRVRIVDFHAEATSEKKALALYLDGRVSAVFGTHTHVQTADAVISPCGTAMLTDLGMCGVEEDSVLGMSKSAIIAKFRTGLPQAFKPARGLASVNGALVEIDPASGKALALSLVRGSAASIISA